MLGFREVEAGALFDVHLMRRERRNIECKWLVSYFEAAVGKVGWSANLPHLSPLRSRALEAVVEAKRPTPTLPYFQLDPLWRAL